MYVAFYCGQNHRAARCGIGLLHVLLQVSDRRLHGFGGLKHLRHNQFIVIEQPADLIHPSHKRPIDDCERRGAFGPFHFQVGDQSVLRALHDVARQPPVQRQVFPLGFHAPAHSAKVFGDGGDMELVDGRPLRRRLLAPILRRCAKVLILGAGRRPVEEEAFSKPPLLLGYGSETLQFLRVHDGEIETRLRAVIQKDGVDYFARRRRQSEGDVGNAEHGLGER